MMGCITYISERKLFLGFVLRFLALQGFQTFIKVFIMKFLAMGEKQN